jgi:hypothetical protein
MRKIEKKISKSFDKDKNQFLKILIDSKAKHLAKK